MDARLLQSSLVQTIRTEFEHNISQQVYVSATVWETTKIAKEEVIKIINIAATQVPANATNTELSKKIFDIVLKLESSPTQIAINQIKNEVRQLF